MAARKLGVYMSGPLERLIANRGEQDSLSGRLSTVADRYLFICEKHKPNLSEAEWNACRDALNGVWMSDTLSLSSVWASVYDADDDGLGAKWDIDAKALAERIRSMDKAAIVSLVEHVEQWWANENSG